MFRAALFTIAKTWKQPKHPQTDEWKRRCDIGTSQVVQWLRLRDPNAEGPGSTPGQGTLPQLRVHMPKPKILCVKTKTRCSPIK